MQGAQERGGDMNKPTIGGQAVIEGVMMKSPDRLSLAVRAPDGSIVSKSQLYTSISSRSKVLGLPTVRGVASFIEMLTIGMQTLTDSAQMAGQDDGEELSKARWL